MGRAKYAKWVEPEGLAKIEDLAASLTDGELAAAMEVSASTFYRWLSEHSEISEAVTRGRGGARARANIEAVEESLLGRCIGGVHNVAKGFKIREREFDKDTGRCIAERERVEIAVEQVYVPADTNAIKFFLTNRAPEKWKNKTELSADPETAETVEEFLKRLGEGGREF